MSYIEHMYVELMYSNDINIKTYFTEVTFNAMLTVYCKY